MYIMILKEGLSLMGRESGTLILKHYLKSIQDIRLLDEITKDPIVLFRK
jgi:hypothetical protein